MKARRYCVHVTTSATLPGMFDPADTLSRNLAQWYRERSRVRLRRTALDTVLLSNRVAGFIFEFELEQWSSRA